MKTALGLRIRSLVGLVGMCVVAITAPPAHANLVVNGGFESLLGPGTLQGPGAPNWEEVETGSTRITGWSVNGSVDIVRSPAYAAQEGQFAIDLAGTPGPGAVYQNLNTTPGTGYLLSFWASSNGASSLLEVYWDGSLLASVATPAQFAFQQFTYSVTGGAGPTTELRFRSPDTDYQGAIIDNVQVVPLPPAIWLLGASMVGLMGIARRRSISP